MKKLTAIVLTALILLPFISNSMAVWASDDYSISISAPRTSMVVGQSIYLSATVSPSGPTVTWRSSNDGIATVTNYGMVTALKAGSVVIRATCTDPTDNSTLTASIAIQIYEPIGLSDDTSYYIMNYAYERLISLSSASDANNVSVSSRTRSDTVLSQWRLHALSDHRFQFISEYSSSGRVLYRGSSNNMVISNAVNSEYSKFTIGRISSGFYKGLYYIMVANKYLSMNNSGDLILTSSLSMYSYWSFMPVEKGKAVMYGTEIYESNDTDDEPMDSTVNYPQFTLAFDNGYDVERQTNVDNETIYNNLSSDVWIFSSHGSPGIMWCFEYDDTDNNNDNGAIIAHEEMASRINRDGDDFTDSYINRLAINELADTRLVFYFGCLTGNDYYTLSASSYNLVDETFEKGAHCVIGLTKSVEQSSAFYWMDEFLLEIYFGNSIEDAIAEANRTCNQNGGIGISDQAQNDTTLPIYIVGDKYQYLK